MAFSFFRKHVRALLAVLLAVVVIAFLVWRLWPLSGSGMRRCAVVVERRAWVELRAGGRSVVYLSAVGDSLRRRVSLSRDLAQTVSRHEGFWVNRTPWWPSCRGRVVVADTMGLSSPVGDNPRGWIEKERRLLSRQLSVLTSKESELKYFLRVHGVSDPGFNRVSAEQARVVSAVARCRRLLDTLAVLQAEKHVTAVLTEHWTVYYHNTLGRIDSVACRYRSQTLEGRLKLLQTIDGRRPTGCDAESLWPWNREPEGDVLAVGFEGLSEAFFASHTGTPVIVPGTLHNGRHDFARLLAPDGAPVFTRRGNHVGVVVGRQVYPRSVIRRLFEKD